MIRVFFVVISWKEKMIEEIMLTYSRIRFYDAFLFDI